MITRKELYIVLREVLLPFENRPMTDRVLADISCELNACIRSLQRLGEIPAMEVACAVHRDPDTRAVWVTFDPAFVTWLKELPR